MLKRIPLGMIYGNPAQPRKIFDEADLHELAASIREHGLLQPITVRRDDQARFMIVLGERRWRAHQIAGLPDILCQVERMNDDEVADRAIIENLQRADITPLEEARAYQARLDTGLTVEQVAKRLGIKQPHRITERTALLRLKDEYHGLLGKGQLSPSQAYEMSRLSPRGQDVLFKAIRTGQCPSYNALRAMATGLLEQEGQVEMFGADVAPSANDEDRHAARRLEVKIEQVAGLLAAGFDENECVAAKKVDPNRALALAERLVLIQKSLKMMEHSLRTAAVQAELLAA